MDDLTEICKEYLIEFYNVLFEEANNGKPIVKTIAYYNRMSRKSLSLKDKVVFSMIDMLEKIVLN